jgi:hypothetical protein
MWLLVGPLGAKIAGDGAIIIKPDPLRLLVEPTADGDMKARYFPVIEGVAHRWLIEHSLIVEDLLPQMVELVLISFREHGGIGFMVGNSLE